MKLVEMGGREEILLEITFTIMIMQGIMLEVIATILINPSMKGDTICRISLIFILLNMIVSS
jgi:hypothetical protein